MLLKPGPMTTLRPRLPKWVVGEVGLTKTEVSNQRSGVPMIVTGPVTSGRSVFATPLKVEMLVMMLTGLPLCDCTIAPSCHPATSWLPRKGRA